MARVYRACHHAFMVLWHYELSTPLGLMRAAFDGRGRLCELALEGLDPRKTTPPPPKEQREAKRFLDLQLEAYVAGTLRTFTVPIEPQGTATQMRIWEAVGLIPYGKTRQLAEFASDLGRDEEVVLMACAGNPIAVLIPVHRVILPGEGRLPKALRDLESGRGWRKP